MKHIFFVVLFVFLAGIAGAQVYTINCNYRVQIISTKHFTGFDRIDTGFHYKFVVDLDKMIISNPYEIDLDPDIIPITEVKRFDEGRLLRLYFKRNVRYKSNYYQMQLGATGEPMYIERAEQSKNGSDTFFRVHTNDLATLFFREDCLFVKDTVFTPGSTQEQTRALKQVKFRPAKNRVEMRDGVITWTDEDHVVHHAMITETILQKYPGTEGIVARCSEGDVYYDVSYTKSDRSMDMDDHYSTLYIVFTKYVDNKMVSVTIWK